MVCIGEGEDTLLELVNKMESGKDVKNILGLWVKENGRVFKSPIRPLETNLDKFPFPDREIFDKRHFIKDYPGSPFLTSRGCPYKCTYRCNHLLQKIYNYKNYVRFRSVDNVLDEMEFVKKKYKIKYIWIVDDTFTIKKDRVLEFCKKYSDRVALPFRCMANPNSVDREMMFALKEAGCLSVHMGIESGNDILRCKIMKRHFSKTQIINAFKWAKEAGMKTVAYNVLGIPYETRKTIMETIKLNRRCRVDAVQASIFYPFPYTELWRLCKNKGYITSKKIKSYFEDTILNLPTINRKELIALQRLFHLYVKSPRTFRFVPFALEKIIRYSSEDMIKFWVILINLISTTFFSIKKPSIERAVGIILKKLQSKFR
jgi:radical SAM superfamily enzyme YgiQ (UPF0313 family)